MDRNIKRMLVLSAVLVAVAVVGFAVMASYQQWTLNHGIETPSPTLPPITPSPPPLSINDLNFTFTSGSGKCTSHGGVGVGSATIKSNRNEIIFSGYAITSVPCYYLTATCETSGNEIFIDILRHPHGELCVQCIGEVPFSGKITGLGEGTYRVIISIGGSSIAEKEVKIGDDKNEK